MVQFACGVVVGVVLAAVAVKVWGGLKAEAVVAKEFQKVLDHYGISADEMKKLLTDAETIAEKVAILKKLIK